VEVRSPVGDIVQVGQLGRQAQVGMAITVEGDFIYVLLADRSYNFAIVRLAR
jgi:hypothetical protein